VFAIGGLLTKIAQDSGLTPSSDLADLDISQPYPVSFYTGVNPINKKDALDSITNDAACWWSINPLGELTAGSIEKPNPTPEILLNTTNIDSLDFDQIIPAAWRIRVGWA